ncbi:MAG: PadR family transcriptional regulator [Candidatus Bathyarchaeota archaeon]|nr:PadR family transcriptional regulator [Candidatus Bathyarchaeota archaeon]
MDGAKEKAKKLPCGYGPKDIETRVVKNFLDILILIELKKQTNLSGYDVTAFVNGKFGGILSPGTVYATIYSIERKGLIVGEINGRKTVYRLTETGVEVIEAMMTTFNKQMTDFVRKFFMI